MKWMASRVPSATRPEAATAARLACDITACRWTSALTDGIVSRSSFVQNEAVRMFTWNMLSTLALTRRPAVTHCHPW